MHPTSHNPATDPDGDMAKRRKTIRACDLCRSRKVRCDSADKPGQNTPCSTCEARNLDCTFYGVPRAGTAPKGYIEALEARCYRLEEIIRAMSPTFDLDAVIGPPLRRESWARMRSTKAKAKQVTLSHLIPDNLGETGSRSDDGELGPPIPDSPPAFHPFLLSHESLPKEERFNDFSFGVAPDQEQMDAGVQEVDDLEAQMLRLKLGLDFQKRFHGKSSSITYIQEVLDSKEHDISAEARMLGEAFALRPHFWQPRPWERTQEELPQHNHFRFPPSSLADVLIDAYFKNGSVLFPVLHRPTFERQRRAGLHHRNLSFAKLYLMTCALGSRYSDDHRTCYKSPSGEVLWHSAGWVFFKQVASAKRSNLAPITLVELQVLAMTSLFLQGCSAPHAAWLTTAEALKFCQDVGAHREKVYLCEHPLEREMWKRVFWALVIQDVFLSAILGRPTCISEEDVDAEFPLQVDDENYDEALSQWAQPVQKEPSTLTATVWLIKLVWILARVLKKVYMIQKSRIVNGFVGNTWANDTVSKLDSALNQWLEDLPEHLQFDPAARDRPFFQHTAALRLAYYFTQIATHRPFISNRSGVVSENDLSLPSLTICVNAGRASSRILETYVRERFTSMSTIHTCAIAWFSGITLAMGIWNFKQKGLQVEVARHIEDAERCKNVLAHWEDRWMVAGRYRDILSVLIPSVAGDSDSSGTEETRRKRVRDFLADAGPFAASDSNPEGCVVPNFGARYTDSAQALDATPSLFDPDRNTHSLPGIAIIRQSPAIPLNPDSNPVNLFDQYLSREDRGSSLSSAFGPGIDAGAESSNPQGAFVGTRHWLGELMQDLENSIVPFY